jgi:N6-adenosine-specific RNA methylase IME4
MIYEKIGKVPQHHYKTIYVDFAWSFRDKGSRIAPDSVNASEWKYDTMNLTDIKQFAKIIKTLATNDAHLWFWTVKDFRKYAETLMQICGFTFKTEYIWAKISFPTKKVKVLKGKEVTKMEVITGIRRQIGMGHYNRMMHEYLLFGVGETVVMPINGKKEPSVVIAKKSKHSKKPEKFYELIERNSQKPMLELFARNIRDGWDSFGNQIDK